MAAPAQPGSLYAAHFSARAERARQMETNYTTEEVAARLGCGAERVRLLAKQGRIPHLRLGHGYRFPKTVLDKWIDDLALRNGGAGDGGEETA